MLYVREFFSVLIVVVCDVVSESGLVTIKANSVFSHEVGVVGFSYWSKIGNCHYVEEGWGPHPTREVKGVASTILKIQGSY